jgi:hypothetical protein
MVKSEGKIWSNSTPFLLQKTFIQQPVSSEVSNLNQLLTLLGASSF